MLKILLITLMAINSKNEITYISEVKISFAIVMYETGRLQCTKCALDNKNLFGFMWKGKFKKYDSYFASIRDYRKWQLKSNRHFLLGL